MKKHWLFLILFILIASTSIFSQVKINFIRYKQIEFNNYTSKWQEWPSTWSSSGAYAVIESFYDDTYIVSIYTTNDELLVSSTCTFDSDQTTIKRNSEDLQYLNCYSDYEGDQIWTNVVSLQSLLENVDDWRQDGAQLYLWVFSATIPFAFVLE